MLDAMPPDRRWRIEKRFQDSLVAVPLDQLRKTQEMPQLELAEILGVKARFRKLSTARTSVSARSPITLKLWAAGWRFGQSSKGERVAVAAGLC
jgi:hypothetical protein